MYEDENTKIIIGTTNEVQCEEFPLEDCEFGHHKDTYESLIFSVYHVAFLMYN